MSNVNVNVSITNVPQFDRHQSDTHRTPMVSQEQNAEIADNQMTQRMRMPVEPDTAEGKITDPQKKREEEQRRKRRKRQQENGSAVRKMTKESLSRDEGRIIDLEA